LKEEKSCLRGGNWTEKGGGGRKKAVIPTRKRDRKGIEKEVEKGKRGKEGGKET